MMQLNPKIMGMRIKKKREALGLSQKKLAEQTQISPPAINQYEKGFKTPSTETLLRLAGVLDVSVDYLIGTTLTEEILIDDEVADAFNLFKCLSSQQRQHAIAHIRFLTAQEKESG
jgi:transcriptional regulator with XRE-family HTH domain